jgi:arylsulfatase A
MISKWAQGLALAVGCFIAPALAAERPNIIVILCDDLGYGDLACFGHPIIKTPNLDRLASQGMKLTSCYAAAPVCSSSRAGLMTGRTPSRVGVYDWIPAGHVMHMRASEVTVPQLLKQAGYDTAVTGKWHLNGKFNSPQQPQPGDFGFDHWFATQNNASPSHHNPQNFVRNGQGVGPLQGYSCQIVADEAIGWLKARQEPRRPFFLYVAFHEPHEPVASPPDLVQQYLDRGVADPSQAEYYANVQNMDAAVGRLLAALAELKLEDNTLVLFTSDNGPETLNRYRGAERSHGSPGELRGMKLWLYEGGIRVPGILRFPGRIKPGQVIDEPVCGVDLLPTACELAGVAPPSDRALDGASFTPVFKGKAIARSAPLYWHYYRAWDTSPVTAMRQGDWMVLGQIDRKPRAGAAAPDDTPFIRAPLSGFELFNLRTDLRQKTDAASAEPQRLQQLADTLNARHQQVLSEAPDWQPAP